VAVAAERVAEALAVEGREAAVPVVEVLAAAALAVDKTAADRVAAAERNPPSMMAGLVRQLPRLARWTRTRLLNFEKVRLVALALGII
jgi:hypothetical protein